MLTQDQIIFGMGTERWTVQDLARETNFSRYTIVNALFPDPNSKKKHKPNDSTIQTLLRLIVDVTEKNGYEFMDNGGIQPKPISQLPRPKGRSLQELG